MEREKNPVGRPRIEFNAKLFENLCHIQCTQEEIAATMGMSVDTLERRVKEVYEGRVFAVVFAEKREGGKSSLRRAQWKNAIEKGNPVMQIFLGKNLLGQKDKQEVDQNINAEIKIKLEGDLSDWSK